MAHNMVIHAANYKKGAVGALQRHNFRENENYQNQDIDPEKTKENETLHQPEQSQFQDTKAIIEERAVNQVRSTSVWQTEFVISSDKEFFNILPREEQSRFFKECYKYLENEFGKENVVAANVHYDETTPHMHFDFVPMTKENKLSRKEVMTRERLFRIQDEMPKYLKECGFDVTRGRETAQMPPEERPKHKSTQEYKKELNEEITGLQKRLKKEKNRFNQEVEQLKDRKERKDALQKDIEDDLSRYGKMVDNIRELPRAEKGFTGKLQLSDQEYRTLQGAAQYGILSRNREKQLSRENRKLKEENQQQKEEIRTLQGKLPTVSDRLSQNQQRQHMEELERENKLFKSILQQLRKLQLPKEADKILQKLEIRRPEKNR